METSLEHIAEISQEIASRLEAQQTEITRLREEMLRLRLGKSLDVLDTSEVMVILGIKRTKLQELIASGELKMWKLPGDRRHKITRAGLDAFIRRQAAG